MISFQNLFRKTAEAKNVLEVEWQQPPADFFDNSEGVHIWKIKWADISSQQYISLLTEKEYHKILKFRTPEDRRKRLISRGILKELSAKYLISPPKNLNYETNKYGKPFITNHTDHLQFNISHSDDYILMAFGFEPLPLGIDIEKNNLLFNYLNIADQYFSVSEKESLACETPSEQFFKIWTRKEAMIKAIGKGLNDALFEVDVLEDIVDLTIPTDQTFFLKTFKAAQDYMFSIASLVKKQDMQFFNYDTNSQFKG